MPLLDDPPKGDLKNFLGYCEAWGHSILHHHDTEVCTVAARAMYSAWFAYSSAFRFQEATVFPILNKKMDFSHEKEQHTELHAFLDKFLATIKDAQAEPSKFNAVRLKELMVGSKDVMVRATSLRVSLSLVDEQICLLSSLTSVRSSCT